jgi:hypothetical protein
VLQIGETWGVSEKQHSASADHIARSSRVTFSSSNKKKSFGFGQQAFGTAFNPLALGLGINRETVTTQQVI